MDMKLESPGFKFHIHQQADTESCLGMPPGFGSPQVWGREAQA